MGDFCPKAKISASYPAKSMLLFGSTESSNQTIFSKNFDLLKIKYRKQMTPNFDLDLLTYFFHIEGGMSFLQKT